jgi:hypothetical protein
MQKIVASALALLALALPVRAATFALPPKNPTITMTLPDAWKPDEIEYGYSAISPDKDVFFSVEYTDSKHIDKMTDDNAAWMKENKIVATAEPVKSTVDFHGLKGDLLHIVAKDENGPTNVDFVFTDAGHDRIFMFTLWASDEEMKNHAGDVDAIVKSIKPMN